MSRVRSIVVIVTALTLYVLYACSSRHVEPYPSTWPKPPIISSNCTEVSGRYSEEPPHYPGSAPPGVWAFLFPHGEVRLNDRLVKSRLLSVSFDQQKSVHVDYLIDGTPASSKILAPSDYMCDKAGLQLSIHKRTGSAVFDKIPNVGTITITTTMFRVDDYLYVKTTWDTKALMFYIIPSTAITESWNRFAAYKP